MKYVVTGGAGFIGSHIVERLSDQDKEVVIIDNLSTGKKENLKGFIDKVKFIQGDILNSELLKEIISENDIIFHQAALPSVARSVENPILSNRINVEGTLNVLTAARDNKAARVIFASSSSIYGDSETLPKIETMPANPKSPYALSKYAAETYMRLFFQLYCLETVSLRYFNVFGPRQDPDSEYSAVIPKFIKSMASGKTPVIYGDGTQTRDFTFIKNVVNANLLASESDKVVGKTINVAAGKRFSLIDLVDNLNSIIGSSVRAQFEEERKGDVKHSLADISKARTLMGYTPEIEFREGLKKTFESLR
ncbi:SDR family oxidoreductase [Candidatus Woesearchaeota archaeon]|nr:SDR family oxidoreductase [Candidatus Woesearchaeota archaeon]